MPESSCTTGKTGDVEIFITSGNDDRKTIKPTRIASRPLTKLSK